MMLMSLKCDPETTVDEDVVNDIDHVEHVDRVDGDPGSEDSDLEDSDYDKSDFTDFENDYEDEVSDVGVGVNVDSGNVEGSDEVRFDSDADSERSDSLHSPDGSDADGPHKKPQQRASSSTERRAPRPKLPIRINQGQAPTQPPPPVHIVRWMPTPTFPSSRESSVSQSSTPTAPAQKKSMNDP
ncbi:hypothetical protein V6N12_024266 [Hibiscus sabdariffa]|uniref:Uncharacterized protein n=1 Tax=Hibiscus sabdariffa TaxID=183260 RepID=A0ABR2G116_9ROSI